MNEKIIIIANKRKIRGKKVKQLRRQGILPANLFGKGINSLDIEVLLKEFLSLFKKAGETHIVELKIDGSIHNALIHGVQIDPVTDTPLHVDFQAVSLKEKTTATVPIQLRGESPAEKEKIGILVQQLSEIDVEALPTDLPDHLDADVSGLANVDATIYVKDLKFDKSKVTIKREELEKIVAKVEPPTKEKVVTPPPTVEAPTEGAAAPEAAPPKEAEEKKDKEGE